MSYKTINLKPTAYADLLRLANQMTPDYASVNLGNVVAQLIAEKLVTDTLSVNPTKK